MKKRIWRQASLKLEFLVVPCFVIMINFLLDMKNTDYVVNQFNPILHELFLNRQSWGGGA